MANGGGASNTPSEMAAAAAILSAIISVLSTLFNEMRRRAHERKMAEFNAAVQERLLDLKRENDLELARRSVELKAQSDLQLAQFNMVSTEQLSAEAARRTYEYEARKRLYHDCEPLLFQLSQNARVAIGRVISLARNARDGQLEGPDGALSGDLREASGRGYYFRSTLYQLLAPLGVSYILQTNLTFQDMSLDPWTERQFLLSEAAYEAFTRDFLFAGLTPAIDGYRETADRPNAQEGVARHRKQGVFLGRLDIAVNCLVERNAEAAQVITFGAFEKRILNPNSELAKAMEPLASIFATFHPGKCPVTWRILVAQYFILRAIRLSQREKLGRGEQDDTLTRIVLNEATVNELAWKQPADEEVTAPLHIGLKYLASALHQRPLTAVPITRCG